MSAAALRTASFEVLFALPKLNKRDEQGTAHLSAKNTPVSLPCIQNPATKNTLSGVSGDFHSIESAYYTFV